jgi:L-iditol 2-dehydrogenase
MKALVIYGPGKYGFESEWPEPSSREGWAIIRTAYSGVCGSDLTRFAAAGSYHHPMVLGHEFSGTVEKPSANSKFKKGDPVAVLPIIPCGECEGCSANEPFHCRNYQFIGSRNDGGFAEFCAVPESNIFPLSSCDDLKQGAFLEPMAVGLHAVRRSRIIPGKSAIVFGAGPIGLLIGLWLKAFGTRRIALVDIRQKSLEMAKRMGFDLLINPLETDISAIDKFDCAFEAAGSNKALLDAIGVLKDGGSLTIVGRDVKDTTIPLKFFEMMMRKEITANGCWGYNMNDEWEFVSDILSGKKFPLEEMITHEVAIEESDGVIRRMCEKSIDYCKVLIKMHD